MKKMATFFDEKGDKVVCNLCPNHCVLGDNEVGVCKVRYSEDGILYTKNYGDISSIAMDPIEKKPLYHFKPGTKILSIGTWGCNFKCGFCQNWEISQEKPPIKVVTPQQIVDIAVSRNSSGIAYTYSEPIVWYEFVLDTSRLAVKNGLYNVLITNGYIELEPLKLLIQNIHAMNIDLKGSNKDFYRKECGGDYESVLKVIEYAIKSGVWVEVTTLVIPGKNDNEEELINEFKALSDINKDIPLHLSRYFPSYNYDISPTSIEKLERLYDVAKEFLNYVYIGNIFNKKYETTYCPECHSEIISREGYDVQIKNLTEEGKCSICGRNIAIV
ncbi:AmmeMemoRadiSam system radical SAM enzyme [Thermosipho ferrireducens]|uniref:AmmeMemoRadiSam system radical SAM enzyme n=1 Tax=Thermosipho ferrireducens TaxID=2571116 RepID=A0ABX7S660_9BACT|nr:AmmeMemoRadiSam system radical SAM enzyme [Thermosipho ferrireducens]QTA37235.1 AmmeMemoRadiSam system radical SAM enzyme [Thermosipho ferrireducens]